MWRRLKSLPLMAHFRLNMLHRTTAVVYLGSKKCSIWVLIVYLDQDRSLISWSDTINKELNTNWAFECTNFNFLVQCKKLWGCTVCTYYICIYWWDVESKTGIKLVEGIERHLNDTFGMVSSVLCVYGTFSDWTWSMLKL